MRPSQKTAEDLIFRFKLKRIAQVDGYNEFKLIKQKGKALIVTREDGEDTEIPVSKLIEAIELVRKDPSIYDRGPGALHDAGILHVSSPIWATLHLMSLEELKS